MKKSIFAFLVCSLAVVLVSAFAVGSAKVAFADEAATDKSVADFTTGSHAGFTLSGGAAISQSGVQLIGDGTVSTQAEYKSFMAQVVVGDMVKGYTIGFGDADNRCSVRIDGAAARISAVGLKTASGSDTVALDDYLTSGAIVKIEAVGGSVEIAVKNADEPYDALGTPVAVFTYADGVSASRGKVTLGVFDGAICAVKEANVYSLDPTITIPTENYVEPKKDGGEEKTSFNPLYVIIPCAGAAVVAAAVTITLVVVKRRKHEK